MNFKGRLYMWSCEGVKYLKSCENHGVCAQDSDRKSPLQKHEELDKERDHFMSALLPTRTYFFQSECSGAAFCKGWEHWMFASENSATYQEKFAASLEGQQRLKHFMLWAPEYIVRVFLQEYESLQASNKSCYFLSTEKRNTWWSKAKNKFEFK